MPGNEAIRPISLDDLTKDSTLTTNVRQDYFVTTYDKVKLALIEYEENKKIAQNWWSYFSMALSFALPCFTAEFQSFLFISAEFLKSFFLIAALFFTILTVIAIIKRIKNRKILSINYCVSRIKNSELK